MPPHREHSVVPAGPPGTALGQCGELREERGAKAAVNWHGQALALTTPVSKRAYFGFVAPCWWPSLRDGRSAARSEFDQRSVMHLASSRVLALGAAVLERWAAIQPKRQSTIRSNVTFWPAPGSLNLTA
jgi:hypothetical protein